MADLPAPLPHYGLPPLPSLPCPEFRGPTPWSNWVIRGRVLAGAYPASLDDYETERILTTLLELGVNTFVCLQAEFVLHAPEAAWRTGQALRPYIKDAQRILIRARETRSTRIKQDKLDFLHLPIIDGSVTSDTALSRLADDCNMRILRGERLYIHCWGGHGRTGTLVATMLGRLYSLSCGNALRYTQAFHDSRKFPQGVRSPQTQVQVAQVRRLLPDPASIRGVSYPQPTIPLTDEILRPSSAPSSPAALRTSAPASPLSAVEAAEAVAPSTLPINQQRKEAIRAKQSQAAPAAAAAQGEGAGGRAGLGSGSASDAITAAISRAYISTAGEAAAVAAGAAGRGGGEIGLAARPQTSPNEAAAQQQAGYVQQYMQQQQQAQPQRQGSGAGTIPAGTPTPTLTSNFSPSKLGSKLGGSSGGSAVINLTASSGAAVDAAAGAARDPNLFFIDSSEEEEGLGDVSGPLRPNKVTVTIPTGQSQQQRGKPEPAVPATTGGRSSSVVGYFSSKLR